MRPSTDPVPEKAPGSGGRYLPLHSSQPRPDECPRTQIIYYEVLNPYVLEQLWSLARSMRQRRINSSICQYADIQELTQAILKEVVNQIVVGLVSRKTIPAKAIQIY